MKYRVLIEQDEDGVFVAEVPSLPGCVSQGRTREEAVENAKEAIAAYLESLAAHDEPIPPAIGEEIVEVTIRSHNSGERKGNPYPLRGKPFRYTDPFASVAEEDWEALR